MEDTCNTLGLKISDRKTKAMVFRAKPISPFQIQIQSGIIEWVTEFRYLCVIIDRRMSFNSHTNSLVQRCHQRLNLMRCISGQKGGASHSVLAMYYRMAIHSFIEYSNSELIAISKTNNDKLDRIQSAALLIITGDGRTANT